MRATSRPTPTLTIDMSTPNDDWFSEEAFWETSYSLMFPQERFDKADAELEAILDLVGHAPERESH